MKNIEVIQAFLNGENAHTQNLISKNQQLINYTTTIAMIIVDNEILISTKKYSTTTSTIQNALRREAQRRNFTIKNVYEF